MSKHTRGPWTTHTNQKSFGIYDDSGAVVATVYWSPITHERRTADARLIAAAPDLLEALRKASDILHLINNDGEYTEECAIARAAIAKAEGN